MALRRRGLSDLDFEELANQVATRVWDSNTFTITPSTTPFDIDNYPIQEWQYTPTVVTSGSSTPYIDPRVAELERALAELKSTVEMMGKLLDEHIRRSNPPVNRQAKPHVFIEREP